jgi:hypothetical protein
MMARKVEITDSYLAVNEEGEQFQIDVHTTFTAFHPVDGKIKWTSGSKEHKLQNGNHVNVLQDGTLEDFVTGMNMRKV